MNRKERRAAKFGQYRGECYDAMRAAADIERYDVAADIGLRENLDVCPVCVNRPVFERHPNGTPDEMKGQRVKYRDKTFWICERCAEAGCVGRSHVDPVTFVPLSERNNSGRTFSGRWSTSRPNLQNFPRPLSEKARQALAGLRHALGRGG